MYLDAAEDRITERRNADFNRDVEASRLGVIFAHSSKDYGRWARRAYNSAGLAGAALESAIGALARTHPEYVVTS